jgi:hypothetical protein
MLLLGDLFGTANISWISTSFLWTESICLEIFVLVLILLQNAQAAGLSHDLLPAFFPDITTETLPELLLSCAPWYADGTSLQGGLPKSVLGLVWTSPTGRNLQVEFANVSSIVLVTETKNKTKQI